jgi:hypothetical protein
MKGIDNNQTQSRFFGAIKLILFINLTAKRLLLVNGINPTPKMESGIACSIVGQNRGKHQK